MNGFLARVLPTCYEEDFEAVELGLQELGVVHATRDLPWGREWIIPDREILKLPRLRRKGGPVLPGGAFHLLTRIREDHLLYSRYVADFSEL